MFFLKNNMEDTGFPVVDRMEAKSTVSVPCWIRAPVDSGAYDLHLLFYYEDEKPAGKLK